ncbi:hypothetical protein [Corallococcus caeni]|uniref:Uncharacterized protein n=1 Tax=Corallococcus caeni TaxID=3082388 RepID=A0ABQ6R5Y8_9BACT|nr:hypothetical protein ASNO1_77420 [Corallococcus sp. NO1]
MRSLRFVLLLAVFAMTACGDEPKTGATVTDVAVSGESLVASEGTLVLTASVSGTGTYSSEVRWSILSGEGSLSATTGESVVYTAPFARQEMEVTVQAASVADTSKSTVFTLTVKRASATALLAGTYVGEDAYETTSGDTTTPGTSTLTLTVEAVSDTQIRIHGIPQFTEWVVVDVLADDSLRFQPITGPTTVHDKYCRRYYFIGDEITGETGTGSWDGGQHLTLDWTTVMYQGCYPIGGQPGPYREFYTPTHNVFTGTKQ